jgi:tRNA(fMet)-specific endonuclease VapC
MSARFMLDTDTVSYALRGEGNAGARILERRPSELCMSAVTLAELRYGAELRQSAKLHKLIDAVAANVAVVPFDADCAAKFGELEAELEQRGEPIGALDVMIAAHALVLGVTLVTNNVKHFRRVDDLTIDNWA